MNIVTMFIRLFLFLFFFGNRTFQRHHVHIKATLASLPSVLHNFLISPGELSFFVLNVWHKRDRYFRIDRSFD